MLLDATVLHNFRNTFVTHFSNSVSILFTLITLAITFICIAINRSINKSITYRISIIVLFGDLLFSLSQIVSVHSESSLICVITTWCFLFSTLLTLLYTVAIALNLQLTVVHKIYPGYKVKLLYYLIPFLTSFCIATLPLITRQISLSKGSCWFKEGTYEGNQWAYATNYGWIMATILYCTIVFVTVTSFLLIQRLVFTTAYPDAKSGSLDVKTSTVLRLLMFPAIPIFCYGLVIVKLIIGSLQIKVDQQLFLNLDIAASFFKGFQGALNAILFLCNSVVYLEMKNAVTTWGNGYENYNKFR